MTDDDLMARLRRLSAGEYDSEDIYESEGDGRKFKLVIVPYGKTVSEELSPSVGRIVYTEDGYVTTSEYRESRRRYSNLLEGYCGGDQELVAMVTRAINKAVFGTSDYRSRFGLERSDPLTRLPGKYLFKLTKAMNDFCETFSAEAREKRWVKVTAKDLLFVLTKLKIYEGAEVVIQTKIVGVTYEGRQEKVKRVPIESELELVRNRHNMHDKNAVAVFYKDDQLGFLCRELAAKLAPLMDDGKDFSCVVTERTGGSGGHSYGLVVEIRKIGSIEDILERLEAMDIEFEWEDMDELADIPLDEA